MNHRVASMSNEKDQDVKTPRPHAGSSLSASRLKTSRRLTANEGVGNDIAKGCEHYSLARGACRSASSLRTRQPLTVSEDICSHIAASSCVSSGCVSAGSLKSGRVQALELRAAAGMLSRMA